MIHNGVELQRMELNGVEVQTWTHNGVEVYSSHKQYRYVMHTTTVGQYGGECNIKIYDYKSGQLLDEIPLHYLNAQKYEDDYISVVWSSLTSSRWTITRKVAGTFTITSGVGNQGVDYGGTSNQWVPYLETTSEFITE